MKTVHKIALAKAAYHLVSLSRSLAGRSDRVLANRRGIVFDLDLSQGIDFAIFLQGCFEPGTARALQRLVRPGQTVLDIGANIGAHTLPLARLVGPGGRVLAFEPTDFAFTKLVRNIACNPDLAPRIVGLQCFLGPSTSDQRPPSIYSSWPLKGGQDVHATHLGEPKATTGATTQTLDHILTMQGVTQVDLVKMDVDGFECDVLDGACELLSRDRPIFVMELAPYVLKERGASLDRLLSHFTRLGYAFFDEDTEERLPREPSALAALIGPGASRNVTARIA